MSKLFFFIVPVGYNKYIAAAASDTQGAVFKGFKNGMEERLLKWHNAWPLNKKLELPFKSFWFLRYAKQIPNDVNYIMMAESFHLSYSKIFLHKLRKQFPKVKLCFMFSNPVGSYNLSKVRAMKGEYDAFFTFAKDDATNYKFHYCDVLPIKFPNPDTSIIIKYDVFFVGKNKGRLDKIYDIYDKLHSLGLRCKFYIVGVPKEDQRQTDEIIYNTPISYDEVLLHVQKSRCILEILQENCSYVSIKTIEAIYYHKKLLTTNSQAYQSALFSPDYIRIVNSTDDIDANFIIRDLPNDAFANAKLLDSYDPMIEYLDKLFENNE